MKKLYVVEVIDKTNGCKLKNSLMITTSAVEFANRKDSVIDGTYLSKEDNVEIIDTERFLYICRIVEVSSDYFMEMGI